MPRRCVLCRMRSHPKPPDIYFFRFPSNPQEQAAWLFAIGKPNMRVNSATCVCSKHFKTEDFWPRYASGCLSLRPNAIPCLNPENNTSASKNSAPDPSLMRPATLGAFGNSDEPLKPCKEEPVDVWSQDSAPDPSLMCSVSLDTVGNAVDTLKPCKEESVDLWNEDDTPDPSLMCSVSLGFGNSDGPLESCKEGTTGTSLNLCNQTKLGGQKSDDPLGLSIKEEVVDEGYLKAELSVEDTMPRIRVEHAMKDIKMEPVDSEEDYYSGMVHDPLTSEELFDAPSGKMAEDGSELVDSQTGQTQSESLSQPADVALESLNCSECSYVCSSPSHLSSHQRTHTGEKPFQCSEEKQPTSPQQDSAVVCSFACADSPTLKEHESTHSGREAFNCDHCSYVGSTKALIKRHMRKHNGETALRCTECSYVCADSSILKMHVRKHTGEKPIHCTHCSYDCATPSQLKRHMRTHSGEKPFHCTECSYVCADATNLKNHIRTHTGENRLQCTQCSYTCVTSTHLKRHMRSHTGEKPFQCEECNTYFAQSTDLKRHIRRHTGERPYRCKECGLGFAQTSTLKRHIRRTHSTEKTFSCSVCSYISKDSSSLEEHLRTHSSEESLSNKPAIPI